MVHAQTVGVGVHAWPRKYLDETARIFGVPVQPGASRKCTVAAILSLEVVEAGLAATRQRLPGGRRAGLHP